MAASGHALCVPGNHDDKLSRHLAGRKVTIAPGLESTLREMDEVGPEFAREAGKFLRGLVSHYLLDEGRLVVAHAGLKEKMQGRASSTDIRIAPFHILAVVIFLVMDGKHD